MLVFVRDGGQVLTGFTEVSKVRLIRIKTLELLGQAAKQKVFNLVRGFLQITYYHHLHLQCLYISDIVILFSIEIVFLWFCRGIVASILVFLCFGVTQAKDGPFTRPHPGKISMSITSTPKENQECITIVML